MIDCPGCNGTGAVKLSGKFDDGSDAYTWCITCLGMGEIEEEGDEEEAT